MDSLNKRIIFQAAVAQLDIDPFGLHGVRHWHNVYTNCLIVDPHAGKDRQWFYWNFAMLHDCCRVNEQTDIEHPYRAAKLIPKDDSDFNKRLTTAIMAHATGGITNDSLVGVCWDADRLDLPRVGIMPKAELMCTDRGKMFAEQMATPPIYDPIEEN